MYENLKPLGIISIVIGWSSMLFLVYKWRGDKSMSFSRHAAAHRSAYLMMAIMESIFLPMYLVFIATWFVHTLDLSIWFTILNAISVIGLVIAAWVPDVPDFRGKIHTYVAYPAYFSMIIVLGLLALSPGVSTVARVISGLSFLGGLTIAYYLFKKPNGRSNFLYLQGSFLAMVHLSILSATYIR